MCSTEMRAAPLPAIRAASTKSRVQRLSAAPRVSRAKTGTLKMPMAMMAFSADGPKTAVIMMAIRSDGKAKTRSLPRMMTSSRSEPRRAAAARPSGTPEAHADPDGDERHRDARRARRP